MLKVNDINVYYGAIHAVKNVSRHEHRLTLLPCRKVEYSFQKLSLARSLVLRSYGSRRAKGTVKVQISRVKKSHNTLSLDRLDLLLKL